VQFQIYIKLLDLLFTLEQQHVFVAAKMVIMAVRVLVDVALQLLQLDHLLLRYLHPLLQLSFKAIDWILTVTPSYRDTSGAAKVHFRQPSAAAVAVERDRAHLARPGTSGRVLALQE
jgi:hypothetical protein